MPANGFPIYLHQISYILKFGTIKTYTNVTPPFIVTPGGKIFKNTETSKILKLFILGLFFFNLYLHVYKRKFKDQT